MSDITAFIWLYWQAILLVLLTLVAITCVVIWWGKVKYFFLNLRWGFPLFGRIARASRQAFDLKYEFKGAPFDANEDELCEAYYKYYEPLVGKDAVYFECCEDYLNKTQQLRRHEKSVLLWFATFLLVAFEAVGFAYVLAPFINRNVSANVAGLLAWTIAIMISIILVPLADQTGRQWHKNSLLKKIRVWYRGARGRYSAEALQGDDRIMIKTTHLDDGPDHPKYLKLLSRIECGARAESEWRITAITVLLISAIAIGAYVVRSNTIAGLETEEVNASPFAAQASRSAFELPKAAVADNGAADKRAASDIAHSKVVAYKTTFVLLSVIFIGVQVFGVMVGFLYSLAGAQNVQASKYIGRFNNAREFEEFYKQARNRVARDAQAKLSALQQVLYRDDVGANRHDNTPRPTFTLFVQKRFEEEAQTDANTRMPHAEPKAVDISSAPPQRDAAPATQSTAFVPPPGAIAEPGRYAAGGDPDPVTAQVEKLGDLLECSDVELGEISSSLGIPLDRLKRRQNLQRKIAMAKGSPAG
jgi:hypothetical protein